MSGIPSKCPKCGSKKQWKEVINPATSGIPIGNLGWVRTTFVRGLFAGLFKEAMGFYTVQYRCYKCGYKSEYELPH